MSDAGERTIRLGDARDRLAEQYDDLAEREADADDSASGEAVRWSLNELNLQGAALQDAIDDHGADATVTVSALSGGEFGLVEDRVAQEREQRKQQTLTGYHRVVYAAAGLVDAPFFDPDDVADPPWDSRSLDEQLDAKIAAVSDLPPHLLKWLYARVDEETTPDAGNWRQSAEQPADTDADSES